MDHGLPPRAQPPAPGVAAVLETIDWSDTALGPREGWPTTLRLALDLVLASPFPMCVIWGPGRNLIYNGGYAAILGPRHPWAMGRPVEEIWPELWPDIAPLVARAYAGESLWFEDRPMVMTRHGHPEQTWFTFSYSPLRDEAGAVRGMLNTVVETSARVRAESALRAAEARNRELLESIGDGFFALDPEFRFTYLNPQGERILGRSAAELVGRCIWDIYAGAVASPFEMLYRRVMNAREPGSLRTFYPDHDRWYELRAFPAAAGITVFFRDVSEEHRTAEALLRSERRYRSFVEASAQLVWRIGAGGLADEHMPDWSAFTGQDRAAMVGMGWLNAVHAGDRPRVVAAWRAAAARGESFEAAFRLRRHDGAWRDVQARGVPVRDEAGRVREWIGTCADVTEQQWIEQRLQLALDGTSDGVWDWNIAEDRVFHSERFAAMLGYRPAEWEGTRENWRNHVHPEDHPGADARLRRALAEADAEYSSTFRMRHRDGRWIWILSRAKVLRDAEGRPVRMVGAHTDITAQKEQEAALAEREARLRTLADSIPQMAWEARPDGAVVWFNRRWHEYTGVERREDAPSAAEDDATVHPDDAASSAAQWARAIATGEPFETEYRIREARTGRFRWHLGRALPTRDAAGRVVAWYGTATDIQDQRAAAEVLARSREELERLVETRTAEALRAEAALRHGEKLQAMGQLTGFIAHDFSNLLQVVGSGLHLMEADELDAADRQTVRDGVRASLENARGLVRQLLAFARQQPLEPVAMDLNARLHAMRELLRHSLGGRVELCLQCAEDLPPVRLDPGALETALLNLVLNARDAMPRGGTLTLRTALEGGRVALSVADTGEGMPPDVVARLFEPFFTTKPAGKGTGLGLAQVHGFITQSGGSVRVESVPGRGACFTLVLPP